MRLPKRPSQRTRADPFAESSSLESAVDSWLIVGLGNPGPRYRSTRHNAGARAAAILAEKLGLPFELAKHRALVADGRWQDRRLLIAQPTTYMNESGVAVSAICRWFNIEPERLVVIHDDIDLATGSLRLKFGGSTAGNHGLDSIVSSLGTGDFFRVRIGVGRPSRPGVEPADYVLQKMNARESEELATTEVLGAEACLAIVEEGLERARSTFNRRPPVE